MQSSFAVRHNLRVLGDGAQTLVLVHGFGCDQNVWHQVASPLAAEARVVVFDLAGAGSADRSLYDPRRHARLQGYADDVVRLLDEAGLSGVDLVGHSVAGMIGALVAIARPDLLRSLIMIGPSACYLNEGDYRGGFDREAIEELLALLESNFLGFADVFSTVATGGAEGSALATGFARRMCQNDPEIAGAFARVTFFEDSRKILPEVPTPTVVMQCQDDPIAPDEAIRLVHDRLPNSRLVQLDASGHCPHLSHPEAVVDSLRREVLAPHLP